MSETTEGSIWFWRIFGSAVIGMITLLSITLIKTINDNNQQNKSLLFSSIQEIKSDIKIIEDDLNSQKEKLSKIEDDPYKEEISKIRNELNEMQKTTNSRSEKIAKLETTIGSLKEQLDKESNDDKEIYRKIIELENELKIITLQSNQLEKDTIKKTMFLKTKWAKSDSN